jgi:lipoate-protein ligase A
MEEAGIVLVRRQSGGGAVYQDLGNSCFTFLSSRTEFDIDRNMQIIINALKNSFGIVAEKSGRNDIQVEGKKISGSAFKKSHDRSFHHGTLLVDVDLDALQNFLNPSKAKLQVRTSEFFLLTMPEQRSR